VQIILEASPGRISAEFPFVLLEDGQQVLELGLVVGPDLSIADGRLDFCADAAFQPEEKALDLLLLSAKEAKKSQTTSNFSPSVPSCRQLSTRLRTLSKSWAA